MRHTFTNSMVRESLAKSEIVKHSLNTAILGKKDLFYLPF